ncbi:MAG: TonB-dependent receptor [Gammaproteobacteria bacterium]|nr:TonB-dependent receptor [Gammaproteobacteria bacterium]MDE0413963.1 TonB-dependent receptor [Gammaproteobacteria bacterium]
MNISLRIHDHKIPAVAAMAAAVLAFLATGASAQSDDEEALELGEQTVTGTRLKGVDPASPRITITREQIERGGYASIEDVLRNLPQNLGSANAAATQLFQGEFGNSRVPFGATLGASGINLRGLGNRSSLVLINGRRKARSSLDVQDLLTDTSSIPLAQIERIEIITDGASAIYGADAVAGVLNIILRDDYDGLSLGVRTETASNDSSRDRIDLGHTFSWDSGYFTTSVNLEQTEPNNPNKLIRVGPDGVGDFTDVGGVNRRNYGVGPAGQGSVLAVNAIVRPWGTTRYAGDHLDGPDPHLPRDPATGDILGPRDPSVPSVFNEQDLGPEVQRYSIRFNGEQRFGESQTLSFEFGYDNQKDDNHLGFNTVSFNGTNPAFWQGSLLVPRAGGGSQRLNGASNYVFLTATNPNNPYGQEVLVGYDMQAESELIAAQELPIASDLENTFVDLGLDGDLPFNGWTYDVSASLSREESVSRNYLGEFGDNASVNAIAENFDPFSGDPAAVANNAALLTMPLDITDSDAINETFQYTAFASGPVFRLPAGEVQLAVGLEVRESEAESIFVSTNFDGSPVINSFTGQPREPFEIGPNKESVEAAFAEIAVPLLKDRPGFRELTLTAAARMEDYERSGFISASNFSAISSIDGINLADLVGGAAAEATGFISGVEQSVTFDNTSPSFGLIWRLTDDLTLRATNGESFLTPLSSQLYGRVTILDVTFNPFSNPFYLTPVPPYSRFIALWGSNPSLQAQTATTTTLTLEYSPAWMEGLDIAVTWSDLAYDNFIATPSTIPDEDLVANFERLPEIFILGDTNTIIYDSRELNLSSNVSKTIDFRVDYRFSTGYGDWGVFLNAVRTLETARQLVPFIPEVDISDTERGPSRWASNLRLTWDYGAWNVTTETYYTSSTKMLEPSSAYIVLPGERFRRSDGLPINQNPQTHAASYRRTDVQVGWTASADSGWLQGLRVAVGAQNVFEPDPPFVDNRSGFAANRVFASGRVLYLNLHKDFGL